MLRRKDRVSCFVFGVSLAWLGAAYAGFTQLNEVFSEQDISEAWKVKVVSKGALGNMYVVADYPKAEGKTEANYAPKRQEGALFDCAVALKLDESQTESLGEILNNWIKGGISAHYIVGQDGTLVEWVNPSVSKAQAVGRDWNGKSVEILLLAHEDKSSDAQNGKMKDLFNYLRETNTQTDVKYLGSHSEARNSGEHGVIKNMDAVREFLGLKPLPEKKVS